MTAPSATPSSGSQYLLFGIPPWKLVLLIIPCAFCVWVAALTISLAGSRGQVQNGLAVAAHFSTMDDLLRREANPLEGGPSTASFENSWPPIRSELRSAQRILEADAPLSQILEPFVDQLRGVANSLDSLGRIMPTKRAAGPSRDAALSRVRVLNARASDLLAATRERLRTQLATLVVQVGRRWKALALISIISMVLAITTSILLLAYGRALMGSNRLMTDIRQLRAKVKGLEGMMPVCAHCKRLRDDPDARRVVELYVRQHPKLTLNLGICPSCNEAFGVTDLKRLR